MTIQHALELAVKNHQAGRLEEAEAIYHAILAQSPNQPDALHLLGVMATQKNRPDIAIDLFRRALAVNPLSPIYHQNLALALDSAGRPAQSIEMYRKAAALKPDWLEPWCGLGNALYRVGNLPEAAAAYRRGLAVAPNSPELLNNLGTVLQKNGELDEAIACFKRAIDLGPNIPDPYSNLGNALLEKKQIRESLAMLVKAAELGPKSPEINYNLANVLREDGQISAALEYYRRAIELRPTHLEAINNLGNVLKDIGKLDEAAACFHQALRLRPDDVMALNNLADAMHLRGDLKESEALCRKAIAVLPDLPVSHWDLALTLLLQGRFEEGWREYAWRRKMKEFDPVLKKFLQPQWDGGDLSGKTILLHTEQGLGDAIHFIRYAPLVKARGVKKIICMCESPLIRLLQGQTAVDQWITPKDTLPDFDVHCSLLDLPMLMQTTLETIPADVPYVAAAPASAADWAARLQKFDGLKVGISWAGKPIHRNDRNRSIPLSALAPLAEIPGVNFFSLQKGKAAEQSQNPPPGMKLIDWTNDLNDFADTAGLVANLDLVISVDTAIIHLAGAMGKPVWVLLPFAPDWRWMTQRDDSPWYPTMRLFRQPQPGDWTPVVGRVRDALKELARR